VTQQICADTSCTRPTGRSADLAGREKPSTGLG
jgi:hypothetical protein